MTRLAIFDFDGTLAEELPPQSLTGVPEHPEVIEQLLTHRADSHTEIYVITGRHRISRSAIVAWLQRVAGINFPPERIYTRWDLDPATGPRSKVLNLQQLVTRKLTANHDPAKPEIVIYDNDLAVLGAYYALLHPLVPRPLRFCLNRVAADGSVEDVTQSLGQALVTAHEPSR
jgi:hypothetical protein